MTRKKSSACKAVKPELAAEMQLPSAPTGPRLFRPSQVPGEVEPVLSESRPRSPVPGSKSGDNTMHLAQNATLFHRHPKNPILSAADWPYGINCVFNAG